MYVDMVNRIWTPYHNLLSVGAHRIGIPAVQMYIPCSNGLDCWTFHINRTAGNFSVIAGHFGVTELEEAGITEYDCLFNIREPVDRARSCLFFFYNKLFQDAGRWSEETFRRKATEEAVGSAVCHNDAARMLVSGVEDSVFMKASASHEISNVLITKALASLKRCVVVDLFEDSVHGEDWHSKALTVIRTYFPWLDNRQEFPRENVSNLTTQRLPHRLLKELEKLNRVDMVIYAHALQQMDQQHLALRVKPEVSRLRKTDEDLAA